MTADAVQAAYSAVAAVYIEMFGDGRQDHEDDVELVTRHLTGLAGPVLDVGCGPGHWTALLHRLGVEVTGVDVVPEFLVHARATHPDVRYRRGSMTDLGAPEGSLAGILAWYSTIHLLPADLPSVLAGFRAALAPGGRLVVGFFDGDDGVAPFDHKVVTAYRWPVAVLAEQLATAGFAELERVRREGPAGSDRRYAAIAARAS